MYLRAALLVVVSASASASHGQVPPSERATESAVRLEVIGCVDGSTLTESNLHHTPKGRDGANPASRWQLAAGKDVMAQIREHADKELRVVGLVDRRDARGTVVAERRVGEKGRVYVGAIPKQRALEERAVVPRLRVESFAPTANNCS